MNVTSVTDPTGTGVSATSTTQSVPAGLVDANTFLQLLITEMKNQDPTSPTDTSQYMSQFAQLSTVEQAVQTNSKLDALLSSSALSQAEGLIGHSASFTDESGKTISGKIASVSINNNGAIATFEDGTRIPVGSGLTLS